ncbi:MAG: hypothetical protein IJ991_09595, partial [Thermoguttaceae bacterium]|nr:hypothetical protein [Thermoguttaceae bacterium]
MASVYERNRKSGIARVVQFTLNGARRTLYLPSSYSRAAAEEIAGVVDRCVDALETGTNVDRRTFAWLAALDGDLRERFERCGLVEPEIRLSLDELFDEYFRAEEKGMRPITFRNKMRSTKIFFERVEKTTDVSDFGKSDASAFISELDAIYSEATRAGVVRDVSRVFAWGVANELIERNPFSGLKRGSFKNKRRET